MLLTSMKQNILIFYTESLDSIMAAVVASDLIDKLNKYQELDMKYKFVKYNYKGSINVPHSTDPKNTHILFIGTALQSDHIETINELKQQGVTVSLLSDHIDDEFDYRIFHDTVLRTGTLYPRSLAHLMFINMACSSDVPEILRLFNIFSTSDLSNEDFAKAEAIYRYLEVNSKLNIQELKIMYTDFSSNDANLSTIIEEGMIISKVRSFYIK